MILLDTNVASLLLKRAQSDGLRQKYESHDANLQRAISFQTEAELLEMALRNNWGAARRMRLEAFLDTFVTIPNDRELCERWASVRTQCQKEGRRLEVADGWILATASLYNLTLLTHDRDFVGLPLPEIRVVCYA